MKRLHLLLIVVAFAGGAEAADAPRHFLWRVASERNEIYLAGSVHVLRESDLPLPASYDAAYAATTRLVLELDLANLAPQRIQAYALANAVLGNGRRLDDVLSKEGYRAFKRRAKALDLPVGALAPLEPWFAAITAFGMEMQEHGYDGARGVDRLIGARALADGRPIGGLETLEQQLGAFDGLPPALQERFLLEMLKDLAELDTSLIGLIDAWKQGDLERMEKLQQDGLRTVPEFYQRLILDRHAAWLPQLEAMLAGDEPTLVVVGAVHLVGPHALVKLLADRGYTVERR